MIYFATDVSHFRVVTLADKRLEAISPRMNRNSLLMLVGMKDVHLFTVSTMLGMTL